MERHRFAFPTEWLYAENVAGEWSAFSDIMKRKEANIQTQIAALQNKIIAEDRVVEDKTTSLLSEWDVQRPVQVCEDEQCGTYAMIFEVLLRFANIMTSFLCRFQAMLAPSFSHYDDNSLTCYLFC